MKVTMSQKPDPHPVQYRDLRSDRGGLIRVAQGIFSDGMMYEARFPMGISDGVSYSDKLNKAMTVLGPLVGMYGAVRTQDGKTTVYREKNGKVSRRELKPD